jgi:hypothetical protein
MEQTPLSAVRALTKAWLRKDGPEMSRWVTSDITELGPDFKFAIVGKKQFFRRYEKYFAGNLTIDSYRIIAPRSLRLSSALSLIHFRYRMQTSEGGQRCDSQGKESMLVKKSRAGWQVKFIHWHQDTSIITAD